MNQPRSLLQAEAQRIEHAVDVPPCPRPSLYSEAGRFVQHDDEVVPVDDHVPYVGSIARGYRRSLARLGLGRHGDTGRQADGLAGLDAVPGLSTLAVEPHLAGAQELLQSAMAEIGAVPLEPAVEPQAGLIRRNHA